MKAFRQTIQELSANDKLDRLGHNKPLSKSRLKQLALDFSAFEDVDLDQWQGYPPPRNSSQVTKNEIHNLISLGQNRDQWEKDIIMHDKKIMEAFKEYIDEHGLEVDLDRIRKIKNQAHPILLSLKRYYNRPRPQVLAKKLGLDLTFFPLKTAETPSYPSGHATLGRLVAKLVADEVPFEHRRNVLAVGERIGQSRQIAGAHYLSDTEFGHRLGDELYRLASTGQEPDLKLEYFTWELDMLNELKFADKQGLAAYKAQHKIRATTTVTVGGKETTAVDVLGKDAFKDDDDEEEPQDTSGSKKNKHGLDPSDKLSDDEDKQYWLDTGFKKVDGKKPAPGNEASMMSEIASGSMCQSIFEKNPKATDDEVADGLYDQLKDTELGKSFSDKALKKKCKGIAKSGRQKYERMDKAVGELQPKKFGKSVKVRNYYGTDVSKQKQKELIESLDGPFYNQRGQEIPKKKLLKMIENAGGGDNPSDTSTIATDEKGRCIVTFHSDKEATSDIQSNSTLNKESENTQQVIRDSGMTDDAKENALKIERKAQKALKKKEKELDTAANGPAREMATGKIGEILDGVKNSTDTKKHFESLTNKAGKPTSNIKPYLKGDGPYSEEQILKAFYDFAGDENKEVTARNYYGADAPEGKRGEITGAQKKLLYRSAKQNDHDISKNLGRIREESLQIQRKKHEELNKQSVELPDGSKKPMGDYIQAQDCIKQLHLGVMDKDAEGVGEFPGTFNVNMGGVIVEEKDLKRCLGVSNTKEFTKGFEVGTPGAGDKYTRDSDGEISGRNIHRFFVNPETGEKIPIAFKTQRSKAGQSGKLQTTMQWSKEMQKCFKGGQKKEQIEKGKLLGFNEWIS